MSLRYEQYNSLKRVRAFLFKIVSCEIKRIPPAVREEASSCLRHFPFLDENGKPMFSSDPFGPDECPEREIYELTNCMKENRENYPV